MLLYYLLTAAALFAVQEVKAEEISGIIVERQTRLVLNINFTADQEQSPGGIVTGTTTVSIAPARYVLLIGSSLHTPASECRIIEVSEHVWNVSQIGGEYPSNTVPEPPGKEKDKRCLTCCNHNNPSR